MLIIVSDKRASLNFKEKEKLKMETASFSETVRRITAHNTICYHKGKW
jgi:hypothetical protein